MSTRDDRIRDEDTVRVSGTGVVYLIGIILFFLGGCALTIYGAAEKENWAMVVGAIDAVATVILFIEYMIMRRWQDRTELRYHPAGT